MGKEGSSHVRSILVGDGQSELPPVQQVADAQLLLQVSLRHGHHDLARGHLVLHSAHILAHACREGGREGGRGEGEGNQNSH